MSNRICALWLWTAAIFVVVLTSPLAVYTANACPPVSDPLNESDEQLNDSRIDLRDLLANVRDRLNGSRLNFDWSAELQAALERLERDVLDRLLEKAAMPPEDRSLSSAISAVKEGLKDSVIQPHNDGLKFITESNVRKAPAELVDPPKRAVILIHGLGRTAFVWNDLIPKLQDAGYFVGNFEYSTDGPITDAADQLASALRDARRAGIERVDVIAHSMGGLVVRDVLTHQAYYGGDGAGSDRYPAIDRLIMLGTPNQGSNLARLTDLGSKLVRDLKIETPDAIGVDVIAGRAGIDLLPDSDFLKSLNQRPLPAHTRITIIAANVLNADRLNSFVQSGGQHMQESKDSQVPTPSQQRAATLIHDLVHGLGDGCVSVNSTKLSGVDDFTVIQANHMSMLFDFRDSNSLPPAIPIILDRLRDS